LIDIGDFTPDDIDSMTQLTIHMKRAEKNLLRWELEGELTGIELNDLDQESKTRWENTFREKHRDKSKQPNSRALEVVDELRKTELPIGDQPMGISFSNGYFYKLADIPEIGFAPDWKTQYIAQPVTT
jgi:hypothetical protein